MKLVDIKEFFKECKLPNEVKLNKHTLIQDTNKFVNTHINFLERNPGNIGYLPYYKRIIELIKILKTVQ